MGDDASLIESTKPRHAIDSVLAFDEALNIFKTWQIQQRPAPWALLGEEESVTSEPH